MRACRQSLRRLQTYNCMVLYDINMPLGSNNIVIVLACANVILYLCTPIFQEQWLKHEKYMAKLIKHMPKAFCVHHRTSLSMTIAVIGFLSPETWNVISSELDINRWISIGFYKWIVISNVHDSDISHKQWHVLLLSLLNVWSSHINSLRTVWFFSFCLFLICHVPMDIASQAPYPAYISMILYIIHMIWCYANWVTLLLFSSMPIEFPGANTMWMSAVSNHITLISCS